MRLFVVCILVLAVTASARQPKANKQFMRGEGDDLSTYEGAVLVGEGAVGRDKGANPPKAITYHSVKLRGGSEEDPSTHEDAQLLEELIDVAGDSVEVDRHVLGSLRKKSFTFNDRRRRGRRRHVNPYCLRPDLPEYDFNNVDEAQLDISGFGVSGVTCATGYGGTPSVSVCTTGCVKPSDCNDPAICPPCTAPHFKYSLSGCHPTCVKPEPQEAPGYNFEGIEERAGHNMSMAGFNLSGISCAEGYTGSPSASVCTTAGGKFSVSGCVGWCTRPLNEAYNFYNVTENLTMHGFDVSGLSCAGGYTGSPNASVCTTPGLYMVSGCYASCVRPSEALTTGYSFSNATETLTIDGFEVPGLSCASGYDGIAHASPCVKAGDEYSVSGCQAICIRPSTEGYDGTAEALRMTGFSASGLSCADGYGGIPIASACTTPGGEYSLSGCSPSSTSLDLSGSA